MSDTLEQARKAFSEHAWDEAERAFTDADLNGGLAPPDLEQLAAAAWWAGHPDDAVEALERAYGAYERAGERSAAALVALRLARHAFERAAFSVLQGWVEVAERLLEGEPESAAHGWLAFWHMPGTYFLEGDLDASLAHADRAIELGQRHGDRDVELVARSLKGQFLIKKGDWREGLRMIDEAAAAAMAGEVRPDSACDVFCMTIAACRDVGDYRRAGEWADQATRWMQRRSVEGYVGICRVHKAELTRLRGDWPDAAQQARRACDELERFRLLFAVGFAHYEIGEVRLHMGDLDGAEEAFLRAHEYGWSPYPGMAMLHLARGDTEEAARSIQGALASGDVIGPSGSSEVDDVLTRARLLPSQVEIALARDDIVTAATATAQLEEIAAEHTSETWEAAAMTARGAVLLRQGDHEPAIAHLKRALRAWQEIDLPYDAAKARLLLAQALVTAGDETAARMEVRAARGTFQRLGASNDIERANALLGDDGLDRTEHPRVIRTFMFTDIVTSTDLVSIIGDDAWGDLLRWHDRALRAAFASHDGEEVNHTGDGFFVAFDRAATAIECAVDIQRDLADHRREQGFAPSVRIGLHTAGSTRLPDDYRGQGVHVAARIGALAEGGEVLASQETLDAAGGTPFQVSDARTVSVKGIDEPVTVRQVDWRR
jgi:class 3 adenylate cyclase